MITELLLSAFMALASSLGALLPTVTVPFEDDLALFADFIGSQLGGLDNIVPISEVAPTIGWALTVYLPFVIAFYSVRWVYSMIPVVGQ